MCLGRAIRRGPIIHEQLFIADRSTVEHACELIALFGDDAGIEASARASRSRDIGNVLHFCHWRQIERMILLFSHDGAIGTIH